MSPMYKLAESLPQWLFNHYQPNTTQFRVQASGFLGDSCLPIETIIRHSMSQTSQWYLSSCGLDWHRLSCETKQEQVKSRRDLQKAVLRLIWAWTISSTSTFPWPFTACRPDFLPPFLSLSPAVLSDNIKAKKTQKIYKISSTCFSQQTAEGNTCSTVSSTWQTACDGFFLVFLHGCGWTPMTTDAWNTDAEPRGCLNVGSWFD